ncbi:lipopolysaccharide biosynthesis protein [Qipengyuania sp.]|uniref:lipopolysaccharide biosynthesis protein n=1 Tax=Qipengyuania sp. TaxID=2004515 RepID=UPI003BAB8103
MSDHQPTKPMVQRGEVARGAAIAALARLGALIEVVAQPIYTWLFGIATYGLYIVLLSVVKLSEKVFGLSLAHALQRIVPVETEERAHAAVKFALIATLIPATVAALLVSFHAQTLAQFISTDAEDAAQLPMAVALFSWALPLLVFAEITTAAIRARRGFGPELRLRILWQQLARLIFAVGFFVSGLTTTGLMLAHLASQLFVAILSIRLLGHYYDLKLLVFAPLPSNLRKTALLSGIALMPSAVARRILNDLPPIILNLILPGAQGATAAGLFGIARKVASIPLMVRQAFHYVLAPLSSAQAAVDRMAIVPIYSFSVRVSAALAIPVGGTLAFLAPNILGLFGPGAEGALGILLILVAGRVGEAIIGPATPIVEMTKHRSFPLINSLAGIAVWAALAWWLTPKMGMEGMAIAVSVATVVIAWAAVIELIAIDRMQPFDILFAKGTFTGIAGILLLYAIGMLLDPLGSTARMTGILSMLLPICWLTLRAGLGSDDRHALGKPARVLRLA